MEACDKLVRGRIKIQKTNPFFAYLSLYLKFKESKDLPEWAGAGITPDGTFFYKKEFIEKLDDDEMIGVLIHEILHISLLHLLRLGNRTPEKWNLAADTTANQIIKDNNYRLPEGCILSDDENKVNIFGQIIENCNKKTTEEIYDELKIKFKKYKIGIRVNGNGKGNNGKDGQNKNQGFDVHYSKGKDGKLSEEERTKLEKDWLNRVEEAYVTAKLRGNVPLGIERLIGKLHENKINWRSLLRRYIQSYIPQDFTYATCSKKSVSAGFYMPNVIKEKIDIIVGIDCSGSIGEKELIDFVSEIVGMARGFRGVLRVRILTHDVEVHSDYDVENGNVEKIKKIQIKGGGGTSHKGVFNHIKEKYKDCVLAVFLSDGYSDINEINFEKYNFDKIFVISENGDDTQLKKKRCKIIKLKDEL